MWRAKILHPVAIRFFAYLFISIPLFWSLAQAQECAFPVKISTSYVKNSVNRAGYGGDSSVPAFVVADQRATGEVNEGHGTVLFVKDNGWFAFMPFATETREGIYVAPSGNVAIVTMLNVEGPGQSWTFYQSSGRFSKKHCVKIDFPSQLNKPHWKSEFLNLADFNSTAKGKAVLIGFANVERRSKTKTLWFRYVSNDNGATWSKPRLLKGKPAPAPGIYRRVADSEVAELTRELEDYASKISH